MSAKFTITHREYVYRALDERRFVMRDVRYRTEQLAKKGENNRFSDDAQGELGARD